MDYDMNDIIKIKIYNGDFIKLKYELEKVKRSTTLQTYQLRFPIKREYDTSIQFPNFREKFDLDYYRSQFSLFRSEILLQSRKHYFGERRLCNRIS